MPRYVIDSTEAFYRRVGGSWSGNMSSGAPTIDHGTVTRAKAQPTNCRERAALIQYVQEREVAESLLERR